MRRDFFFGYFAKNTVHKSNREYPRSVRYGRIGLGYELPQNIQITNKIRNSYIGLKFVY